MTLESSGELKSEAREDLIQLVTTSVDPENGTAHSQPNQPQLLTPLFPSASVIGLPWRPIGRAVPLPFNGSIQARRYIRGT